ncbi:uncharacterized protein LOC142606088 [Castanea sativa]|uniref:uncharacterized protein LOC142606088 n=1 Tax=Castanea sativa TaxID=21020 RepID=UPI003F65300D
MNAEDAIIAKGVATKRKRDKGTNHNLDRKKETQGTGHALDKKKNLLDQRPKFTSFTPLVMPIKDRVIPKGVVKLTIIVGTYPAQVSKEIDFLVVDCPLTYNVILGQPTLNKLKAAMLTYYLKLKFPTAHGIGKIRGDQVLEREYYQAALALGENHTWIIDGPEPVPEPSELPQKIKVVPGNLSKVLPIGSILLTLEKTKITNFLGESQDVFAWKHENMLRIDRGVIRHRLNVNPGCRPVQQRRRIFAPKHNKVVVKEVEKLFEASFIREVFYPEWLANVVMVKKNNGKWRMYVDFTDINKACPNDSFPLPRIDQLVDSTNRHKLLSFIDTFSNYN